MMQLNDLCAALQQAGVEVLACEADEKSSLVLERVADLEKADATALSFLANPKYVKALAHTQAGAVLVREAHAASVPAGVVAIVVDDPYFAYAIAARLLHPEKRPAAGIHSTALVSPRAKVADSSVIGPGVVIGDDSVIDEHVWIEAHCVIGAGVHLASQVHLEPHVILYEGVQIGEQTRIKAGAVIGSDGFGFAPRQGRWQPVPQLGSVKIGKRCSIGANTTIDRGALGDTVIGDDVIIDNLVHLAHNVKVGQGSAIVAQVGISGSTEIGAHCIFAGQSAATGHLKIADGVQIMGRGVASADIKSPGQYGGFPLMPQKAWQKKAVYERNLPKLVKEVKALKHQLATLQKKLEELD